jgi:hypothetical protein
MLVFAHLWVGVFVDFGGGFSAQVLPCSTAQNSMILAFEVAFAFAQWVSFSMSY